MTPPISTLILTIFIVMAVLSGVSIFTMGIYNEYGVTGGGNYSFVDTMNRTAQSMLDNATRSVQGASEPSGSGNYYIKGGLDAVMGFFGSLGILSSMTVDLAKQSPIEIPQWFFQMIIAIITAILIFGTLAYLRGIQS